MRRRRIGRSAAMPGPSVPRWLAAGVVALTLLTTAACGDDSGGPGSWTGTVRSSTAPAGAVVLQVHGDGIRDIDGIGPVDALVHRTAGTEAGASTWRVVLVTPTPGVMSFQLRVDDVDRGAPRAVVMSAVDGQNQPLTAIASFSVELSR